MVASVEISVVIPCFNEAENVFAIAEAVKREIEVITTDYEIIFIDNFSSDSTVALIKDLCRGDPRIRLIANNQNYGQMRSPTYAIYQASGKAVIGICADFQDPPHLIGEFVRSWKAGTQIVLGVKRSEAGSLIERSLRRLGYAFFARFGDYRVIPGATGFGLYDREVVDCLKQWRDPEPFFRGMLAESGFSLELIPYDRPPRARGQSSNNFLSLLSFAISGLGSSSKTLLRLPLYLSFIVMCISLLTVMVAIISIFHGKNFFLIFTIAVVELMFALILFFMGLLGEQVRLIAGMVRNAPLVIERERVNFPS